MEEDARRKVTVKLEDLPFILKPYVSIKYVHKIHQRMVKNTDSGSCTLETLQVILIFLYFTILFKHLNKHYLYE